VTRGIRDADILVTGGAGFIGSTLVEALLRGGAARVRVLDDLSTGSADNLAAVSPDVELTVGSVLDADMMRRYCRGADLVFHLACLGVRHSLHSPVANHEVNATGALTVLLAARVAGVAKVVHVSSSEVYGTARHAPMDETHPTMPETVYGAGKLAGESYARAMWRTYGYPTVVVRPFNNYGPRSHHEGDSGELIPRTLVRLLAGERPVIFGDGSQTRDFLHVHDTARALVALAECEEAVGETVNVGSGVETSVQEICTMLARLCGRPHLTPAHLPARPGDVQRLWVDNTLVERLVGFTPAVTLADGLAELVARFRCARVPAALLAPSVSDRNWLGPASGDDVALVRMEAS
jgi:UDP-glucose 4-epimerase